MPAAPHALSHYFFTVVLDRRCFDSVIVLNGTATVAMVHILRGSPTPVTHHRATNIPCSS